VKTKEEIKNKIKAMKERGYQSYEFGNYLESETCFAFAEALEWVLEE
jgi:hypothetical protein